MELHNQDISLRTAGPEDAAQLAAWWNDGSVMTHAGFPLGLGTSPDEVCRTLEKGRMIIREGSRPIGECVYRQTASDTAEIGIKICETDCQNRGIGKNVLRLLIRWLFQQGYQKIVLDTAPENTRARHVYEELGFRQTALYVDAWRDQLGRLQSTVDYTLAATDFRPA